MSGLRLLCTSLLTVVLAACGDANAPKIYIASWLGHTIKSYNAAGAQTTPTITLPHSLDAIAVDAAGKLYVAESDNNAAGTATIATYTAAGARTTPTITGLRCLGGIAVDRSGKIYATDTCEGTLATYTPAGAPTSPTITGLGSPMDVTVDAAGKIYVFNFDDNTVMAYTPAGVKTTPTITAIVGLFAVDPSGKVYGLASDGSFASYGADGAQTPTFAGPKGSDVYAVGIDGAGKIYVLSATATGNQSILTTYNADGTPSTPTIDGLPGRITLDRSTSSTSSPMMAVR